MYNKIVSVYNKLNTIRNKFYNLYLVKTVIKTIDSLCVNVKNLNYSKTKLDFITDIIHIYEIIPVWTKLVISTITVLTLINCYATLMYQFSLHTSGLEFLHCIIDYLTDVIVNNKSIIDSVAIEETYSTKGLELK